MKHIVTHVQGGQIQLAIVDEESGELQQFGQLLWPEHFGLQESAVLTSNLTAFLGLNGDRPRPKAVEAQVSESHSPVPKQGGPKRGPGRPTNAETRERREAVLQAIVDKPGITLAELGEMFGVEPPMSNTWVGKQLRHLHAERRVWRTGGGGQSDPHQYYAAKDDQPPVEAQPPKQKAKPSVRAPAVRRYVSMEDILGVVAEYPEGIAAKDIAARLWRADGNDDDPPQWFKKAVENRVTSQKAKRDEPLPFELRYEPGGRAGKTRLIVPLAGGQT